MSFLDIGASWFRIAPLDFDPRPAVGGDWPQIHMVDGHVEVVLPVGVLRPGETATITTDWVLTVVDPATTVTARWRATAEGIDDVIEGELTMPVETIDLTPFEESR